MNAIKWICATHVILYDEVIKRTTLQATVVTVSGATLTRSSGVLRKQALSAMATQSFSILASYVPANCNRMRVV